MNQYTKMTHSQINHAKRKFYILNTYTYCGDVCAK